MWPISSPKDGFIAVAPDLLSGMGPNGGGTDELGDKATQVIRNLTPQDAMARLDAVRAYAIKLPAANGKSASIGFCWGGSTSFNYAVAQPGLNAAVVYYGTSPSDPAAYTNIKAPVLGLYGGNDNRVTSTVPTAEAEMKKLGKTYEPHVFEGAGHGFLRQQAQPDGNMKATEQAWPLTIAFLQEVHELRRACWTMPDQRDAAAHDEQRDLRICGARSDGLLRVDLVEPQVERDGQVLFREPARAASVVERLDTGALAFPVDLRARS